MKSNKKTLLFIAFLHLSFFVYGQELKLKKNVKITWGEEIKMKKDSYYSKVVYASENSICLAKWMKGDFYLEMQNKNLQTLKEQEIDLKPNKKDLSLEGTFEFGDLLILLASRTDKKSKTNSLYYKTIDKFTLKEKSDWNLLSEIFFLKNRRNGYFNYTLSEDENKLLIYISQPVEGKDSPERFGFKVFDQSMDLLWKKDIELKYNENLFSIGGFVLSNRAEVYVIGRKLLYREDRPKQIMSKEYHILSYTQDNNNQDYKIDLEDKYIKDIAFGFNPSGNLICSGFYSKNGAESNGIKGVFYILIDPITGNVLQQTSKEIDENFITEDWTDRYKEKVLKKKEKKEKKGKKAKEIEAYKYDLKDLIVYDDGSATLLAEQYYVRTVTTSTTDANGNRHTHTTYHYYYNDIYIIKIDKSGEILWTSKIDKYQHSINDGGYRSSFHLHTRGDEIFLIYNLSTRAYYDKEVWKAMPKDERKNYLTLISTVFSDGVVKDHLLLNNTKEEIYVVPKFCEQIDDNKTLLYTSRRKNVRLGILEF